MFWNVIENDWVFKLFLYVLGEIPVNNILLGLIIRRKFFHFSKLCRCEAKRFLRTMADQLARHFVFLTLGLKHLIFRLPNLFKCEMGAFY